MITTNASGCHCTVVFIGENPGRSVRRIVGNDIRRGNLQMRNPNRKMLLKRTGLMGNRIELTMQVVSEKNSTCSFWGEWAWSWLHRQTSPRKNSRVTRSGCNRFLISCYTKLSSPRVWNQQMTSWSQAPSTVWVLLCLLIRLHV